MRATSIRVGLIILAGATVPAVVRARMGHPEPARPDSVSDSTPAATGLTPAKSITLILHLPPLQASAAIIEAFTDAGYPVGQANTLLVKPAPKRHITLLDVSSRRVQRDGGEIEEVNPGHVVWLARGEKHWRGTAPVAMTHIVLQ